MKDFNYKLQTFPNIDGIEDRSISMLFTSEKEMNAAETMAANLLLFLQDDLKLMNDNTNLFIAYEMNDDSGEWDEMEE